MKECLNCGKLIKRKDCNCCSYSCSWQYRTKTKCPNLKFDESDFTQKQLEILIGSMLGDGSVSKLTKKNSRFSEIHGIKQKYWLLWKQNQLNCISSNYSEKLGKGVKQLYRGKIVSDPTKSKLLCELKTIYHPFFTQIEKDWYLRDEQGNYVYKIVGKNKKWRIKCLPIAGIELTPLILAVWFMDDGINNKQKCVLCTESFTQDEVKYLSMKINEKFNLNSYLYQPNKSKEQYQIYIGADDYLKFLEIIKNAIPDLPKCMNYKIDTSKHKVSWKKTGDGHPYSKFNDKIVEQIFIDAENGIKQVDIAKKYNISKTTICNLLKGKKLYKSKFTGRYNNTSGTTGVSFKPEKNAYRARIHIKKKEIHLGIFKNIEDAINIRKQAERLLKENLYIDEFKSRIAIIKTNYLVV